MKKVLKKFITWAMADDTEPVVKLPLKRACEPHFRLDITTAKGGYGVNVAHGYNGGDDTVYVFPESANIGEELAAIVVLEKLSK